MQFTACGNNLLRRLSSVVEFGDCKAARKTCCRKQISFQWQDGAAATISINVQISGRPQMAHGILVTSGAPNTQAQLLHGVYVLASGTESYSRSLEMQPLRRFVSVIPFTRYSHFLNTSAAGDGRCWFDRRLAIRVLNL